MKHNYLALSGLFMVAGSVAGLFFQAFNSDSTQTGTVVLSIINLTGWVVCFGSTIADRLLPKATKLEYHISGGSRTNAEAVHAAMKDIRRRA